MMAGPSRHVAFSSSESARSQSLPRPDSSLTKGKGVEQGGVVGDGGDGQHGHYMKPWADGPWPLIETPSKTQPVTHPALHIADELANIHNAMLRGLNAIFLQAPFVRQPRDISDFGFLAQSWCGWLLDHHALKEGSMMPGFEAVLGLGKGCLGFSALSGRDGTTQAHGNGKFEFGFGGNPDAARTEGEDGDILVTFLQRVHAAATSAHADPASYSPRVVRDVLADLAEELVPHLQRQIAVCIDMRELCFRPSLHPAPSSSTATLAQPAADLEEDPRVLAAMAETRANRLMQTYTWCESQASNTMDRFVVLPMMVRLRDVTFERGQKYVNEMHAGELYSGGGGRGGGGGANDTWPRLSILAVHAIADKLSPRHAGAWRFLPCDCWGKPRELAFLE